MAISTSVALMTTAIVTAVTTAISTALSITMGIIQSNQQKAVANYQRRVNEQNAQASRQAAQAKIENQRRQAKFTQGAQLARLGGMGALAEGSTLDVMGQTAGQEKYDELVTEYEGETQAIQFQQKAALNKYQADIADYNMGLNTATSLAKGIGSIGNSLLSGASSLSSSASLGKTGDFATPTGSSIDIGKDYLTGSTIA